MLGLFDSSPFMPHGMCLLWRKDLLALHVVSDALIALAYFAIPLVLMVFMRRRPELRYSGVIVMFAAFILFCGASHLVSIWTLWQPDYALQGLVKAATAAVSLVTAGMLWPLLPKFVAMPAPSELAAINARLEEEVARRGAAEQRYRKLAADLEIQVAERTSSLEQSLVARKHSEQSFRAAFDHARNGKAMFGLDGRWVQVNQALCRLLGYSAEELLEINWEGVTHPDDMHSSNDKAEALLSGSIDAITLPKRYLRKDGTLIQALVDVRVARNDQDEILFFVAEIEDLTAVTELEAAVRQSEARASTVIETASDAIFELDAEGIIQSGNPAAERMLGVDKEALCGRRFESILSVEHGGEVSWPSVLASARAGNGHAPGPQTRFVKRADGTQIPVEARLGGIESDGHALYSAIVYDISERVQAERALREAHEALRFHMANSPLAVIEWDRDFNITYWSPSAERIFGWSSDETLNRHPSQWNFVHEDDAETVVAVMAELASGKTQRNQLTNRNYRKDGQAIHAEWFNSIRTDADGNVLSVLSFIDDISERVEAATALTNSEAHTTAILDAAVDGIISIEPDGTILACNRAAEDIFGYPSKEVIGRNVKMLMPAPYRQEHDGYLHNYLATGERKIIGIGREVVGLRKNGEEFPMELAVSEVRTENTRTFTGFVRDISERKNFEKEIVASNRRLQHQDWLLSGHASLSMLLQGDPTLVEIGERTLQFLCEYLRAEAGAFYVFDHQNVLRPVAGHGNGAPPASAQQTAAISGIALKAAQSGRTVTLCASEAATALVVKSAFGDIALHEIVAYPIAIDNHIEAVIELGAIEALRENHQEFLQFSSDTLAVAVSSAGDRERVHQLLQESQEQAAALEKQRQELGIVNQDLRDRSRTLEQKNAELHAAKQEIEDKADALERAGRYKSEFLANMSHELRTPLNSMLVLSRSLANNEGNNLSADDVKCARVIHNSGENLLSLINDILDLSKVEAGQLDIEIAPGTLSSFLAPLVEQFQPIATARGLEFVVESPAEDAVIITDSMRLSQILRNLLANACKFTESGRVTLAVRDLGEEGFEFRISDTGVGIAAPDLERIFEVFQQVDGSTRRRHEGTGLGLSISRELGQLLQARISVESSVGVGSRFTVHMPRVHGNYADPDQHPMVETAVETGPAAATAPSHCVVDLSGSRILIVDDDYRSSFALSRVLGECAAEVAIADSGAAALDKLAASAFDIVVMDLMMPNMNGSDTIRAIRCGAHQSAIPIVAVTADVSGETRREAEAAGADGYILKPIDTATLLGVLFDRLGRAA